MFKHGFKLFKPEVLKPTEDEKKLYSKNSVVPIAYLKSCLKNDCINSFRVLCFLSFVADVIESYMLFSTHF